MSAEKMGWPLKLEQALVPVPLNDDDDDDELFLKIQVLCIHMMKVKHKTFS
jgi:hypothetical protein